MSDPYKILGVDPSASDDDVKRAYRELARKYHPDHYNDNPLSDLAEEKMKEINEAYELIQKQRAPGGAGGYNSVYGGNSYGNGNNYGGQGVYARIRQYIAMGNIAQAEQMLNSVPERGAEWHFLMGAVYYRKGWFDEALRNYRAAYEMEPNNPEYRQAFETMQAGGGMYRAPMRGAGGMSGCDCCANLLCADCCCECMGGDLIPCC